MPEHLRALMFILGMSGIVFALAKGPITAQANRLEDFTRRRNLWYALTLSAFLAHNFWLFVGAAACSIFVATRKEPNRFALYLGVVLALPRLASAIPGFGLMNELFVIEPLRLLSLMILLPAYLDLRKQPDTLPFGRLMPDKCLAAYILLTLCLLFPHENLTVVMREAFYHFIDTFLLYYVASRSLKTLKDYRDALGAFMVGAMVFSAIVALEFVRGWLLYAQVDEALGVPGPVSFYLKRSGLLRAEGTAGQAIITGFVCSVALGLFYYVRLLITSTTIRVLGWLLIMAGLIGAFSRGPWVGAVATIIVFPLLGPSPIASIGKMGAMALAALPVLLSTKSGQVIIDHLPFVGTVDSSNVDHREKLATAARSVIADYPFFGRINFYAMSPIQDLRGSDGIIDLVNTYIIIALKGGLVSLTFFSLALLLPLVSAYLAMRQLPDKNDERHVLGQALIATIVGVLVTIATVSPIFFVYPLLWCLIGMTVGYPYMLKQPVASKNKSVANTERKPARPVGVRFRSR